MNLLTKEERKIVCINRVLERIKEGGKYSDLPLNYGPKMLRDWGVSANNFRPLMKDAFAWMVTEDEVPEFAVQHRTTVSRHAVARAAMLKGETQMLFESPEVTSIGSGADGSKRDKQDHAPVVGTCSTKYAVHKIAIKDSYWVKGVREFLRERWVGAL